MTESWVNTITLVHILFNQTSLSLVASSLFLTRGFSFYCLLLFAIWRTNRNRCECLVGIGVANYASANFWKKFAEKPRDYTTSFTEIVGVKKVIRGRYICTIVGVLGKIRQYDY